MVLEYQRAQNISNKHSDGQLRVRFTYETTEFE